METSLTIDCDKQWLNRVSAIGPNSLTSCRHSTAMMSYVFRSSGVITKRASQYRWRGTLVTYPVGVIGSARISPSLVTIVVFKRAVCAAIYLVSIVTAIVFEIAHLFTFHAFQIVACELCHCARRIGWTGVGSKRSGSRLSQKENDVFFNFTNLI